MNLVTFFIYFVLFYSTLFAVDVDEHDEHDDHDESKNVNAYLDYEENYDEEDIKWIPEAVQVVGYYLRSFKFNGFDRRFYTQRPETNVSNLYGRFVEPPLKHFHWKVFKRCKNNFTSCLRYLYETVSDANLQRSIDTVYIMMEKNLTFDKDVEQIEKHEEDCVKYKELDSTTDKPFGEPVIRFEWSVTASYYMCWFTMLETPELKHFRERCDNFANCLQNDKDTSNHDIRANDSVPFACSMYSFCPDPCYPNVRLIGDINEAAISPGNPCGELQDKTCTLNRTLNTSLQYLVYNIWNTSCACDNRYSTWNPRYGICIEDKNCAEESSCDAISEICISGNKERFCLCRHNCHVLDGVCTVDEVLVKATNRFLQLNAGRCIGVGLYSYAAIVLLHSGKFFRRGFASK